MLKYAHLGIINNIDTGIVHENPQMGDRHIHAKTLSGLGTYRLIYTVEMGEYIFVLHAFQKKSKSGIATPKKDIDTIQRRLKEAEVLYKELKGVR